MKTKTQFLIALFLGLSFFSFSQHKYSLEVESFNGEHPKNVLADISNHIDEISSRYINDGVFTFQSKTLYTRDEMIDIVVTSGYILKEFKILSAEEEQHSIENQ